MLIIKILLFLLGMSLMVQVIAAFYGILDLWYTIRTAWPLIIKRIMIWAGLTIGVSLLLSSDNRQVFLAGLAAYVGIYVAIPLFAKIAAAFISRPIKMEPDRYSGSYSSCHK